MVMIRVRARAGVNLSFKFFLLHFKSKRTQLSLARFEPDQIVKHNNAFTSVPVVHSFVIGGKLLVLPNFLFNLSQEGHICL